uniref:Uncharacterized protein n=1 Tax=Oryza barthii TaxID=65489 RepID=A0A0D3GIW0_9ORYZ
SSIDSPVHPRPADPNPHHPIGRRRLLWNLEPAHRTQEGRRRLGGVQPSGSCTAWQAGLGVGAAQAEAGAQ